MRRARSFLIAAIALAMLGIMAPARAHIALFGRDAWGLAFLAEETQAAGNIRCRSGETFTVKLKTFQADPGYQGRGRTTGECTGETQRWHVRTTRNSGDLRCDAATKFQAIARTFRQGRLHEHAVVAWGHPPDC